MQDHGFLDLIRADRRVRANKRPYYILGVSLIILLIFLGVSFYLYTTAKNKTITSKLASNQMEATSQSNTTPANSSHASRTDAPQPGVSQPTYTNSLPQEAVSAPVSTYQQPLYTVLQQSDESLYENMFALFSEMDSNIANGNYSGAYQIDVNYDNSASVSVTEINPLEMSDYSDYSNSITVNIGKIYPVMTDADSHYESAIIDLETIGDPANQIVEQNAQNNLATAHSDLSQAQNYYSQIPK
ncbi:MAG TPA: hypothetical protein VGS28_00480 [Candidatus Saccharimonadales bacterium]|nr:hypothetical protein [Candidatus Saccharimonadales bacterium]